MPDPEEVAKEFGEKPAATELPAVDEPPRSGVFVEHDELELTTEEIAEGNRLGDAIDVDDDADTGDVDPPR